MHQIVIGLSGHIDHGKTSLIKSLTGKDTDILIDEIESILFTFLNENGEWIQQWPPLSDDKFLSITKRPLGIAVVINFVQEGEIRRIFEVSP